LVSLILWLLSCPRLAHSRSGRGQVVVGSSVTKCANTQGIPDVVLVFESMTTVVIESSARAFLSEDRSQSGHRWLADERLNRSIGLSRLLVTRVGQKPSRGSSDDWMTRAVHRDKWRSAMQRTVIVGGRVKSRISDPLLANNCFSNSTNTLLAKDDTPVYNL